MEFGIIQETMSNGLFGCTLTWILEILPFLKTQNIYPDWQISTHCYGKIIPMLLIPKKINASSQQIVSLSKVKGAHSYKYTKDEFKLANTLFFEFFDISPDILENVESYKTKCIGKTLGIHFRGTDKIGTEATYISIDTFLQNIVVFLSTHIFQTIVIITDEEKFVHSAIQMFSETTYTIIVTDSKKSKNEQPIHFQNNTIDDAKNALCDSLLLSKCDYVIKTSSCLSDWVKIWNPDIEVYNLNRCTTNWFPQSIIPVRSFLL